MKAATCPLVLLLLCLCAPAAVAAECAGPTDPKISVAVDAAPLRIDRSLSLTELTKIPSASRRAGMESYDRTLGLTEAEIGAKADIDLVTTPDGNDGFCSTARAALVVLEWNTVVHIASQIPPGSCMDQVVSTHELKHVEIDRQLIPIGRQAIQIALTAVLRHGVHGATAADSQRKVQDQARAAVNEAVDIFAAVRTRKQLALDNKDEYNKVPKSCGILEYLRVMRDGRPKAGT